MIRFIIAILDAILACSFSRWGSHDNPLSIITPRNLTCSTRVSSISDNFRDCLQLYSCARAQEDCLLGRKSICILIC